MLYVDRLLVSKSFIMVRFTEIFLQGGTNNYGKWKRSYTLIQLVSKRVKLILRDRFYKISAPCRFLIQKVFFGSESMYLLLFLK